LRIEAKEGSLETLKKRQYFPGVGKQNLPGLTKSIQPRMDTDKHGFSNPKTRFLADVKQITVWCRRQENPKGGFPCSYPC
jgi:hypothetical protein